MTEPGPETPTPDVTQKTGKWMIIATWVILLASLSWLIDGWLESEQERYRNPNQEVTSRITEQGIPEAMLAKNRYGHYVVSGKINDYPVEFLVDTGATNVSVPEHIARKLRLEFGQQYRVSTANGFINVYSTILQSVRIGEIQLEQVDAGINPYMLEDQVLLGMSFLGELEMLQSGGNLRLRKLN